MNELLSLPELENEITREQVISAYQKFIKRDIKNPDDLDLEDAEVIEAHNLFFEWRKAVEAKAKGDIKLEHQAQLSITMLNVDAGFTDPDYLKEVRDEFLLQQEEDAETQIDDPKIKTEICKQITEAKNRIDDLLAEQN